MVVDDWHQGVVLDEVGQEGIRIWANLIYLCPHTEEQVVSGTLHRAAVTHLQENDNSEYYQRCYSHTPEWFVLFYWSVLESVRVILSPHLRHTRLL